MKNSLFVVLFSLEKGLAWLLKSRLRFLLLIFFRVAFWLRGFLPGRRRIPVGTLPMGFSYEFTANAWLDESNSDVNKIRELELKLWSGFSVQAVAELREVANQLYGSSAVRGEAAWALARRSWASGDYIEANRYLEQAAWLQPSRMFFSGFVILRFETLLNLNELDAAKQLLEQAAHQGVVSNDLQLAWSNWYLSAGDSYEEKRLAAINSIFEEAGLQTLALKEANKPLGLANLKASGSGALHPLKPASAYPKVSVLMPVYNAAKTLPVAVEGLLSQSWPNLELILVDDVSSDSSREVMQALADQDDRVRVFFHSTNTGAYGARLTALKQAAGEFITVHDADDWSHPQKIETQVSALLQSSSLKACMSSWCRMSPDLRVLPIGAIPGKGYQRQNESSLMFHRSLLSKVGQWDKVRAGADTEFIWRIQALFGEQAVEVILPETPLSFSLSLADSLTQTGPTHVRTIFYGTRQIYRESQKFVHRNLARFLNGLGTEEAERSFFYAPQHLRGGTSVEVDVLYIADFTRFSPNKESQLKTVIDALQHKRVALFNWKYFSTPATAPFLDAYLQAAIDQQLELVTADDQVLASSVVFLDTEMLKGRLDRLPEVEAKEWLPEDSKDLWVASNG